MFGFIISIFIFLLLVKFLVQLGFGVTKLLLSLIVIAICFVIIPMSIALILPIIVLVAFIAIIASILKAAL